MPRELHPRLERLGERTEDFVDTVEVAIGRAVPKPLRVLQTARQNTMINVVWRAGVLLVGLTFVVAGVAMLLLPGPGWASILLGLVILASEYTWANRLLRPVRTRARAAARKARQWDPRVQRALTVITVAGSVAFVAGSVWYVTTYGWSTPW